MLSEITVIVKNEERRLVIKNLEYGAYSVCEKDPLLSELIESAIKAFDDVYTNVQVKISMEVA